MPRVWWPSQKEPSTTWDSLTSLSSPWNPAFLRWAHRSPFLLPHPLARAQPMQPRVRGREALTSRCAPPPTGPARSDVHHPGPASQCSLPSGSCPPISASLSFISYHSYPLCPLTLLLGEVSVLGAHLLHLRFESTRHMCDTCLPVCVG